MVLVGLFEIGLLLFGFVEIGLLLIGLFFVAFFNMHPDAQFLPKLCPDSNGFDLPF